MKKLFLSIMVVLLIVGSALAIASCVTDPGDKAMDALKSDQKDQSEIITAGQTVEPVYKVKNFLARKAINQWSKRMDDPNKLWYVYEYSQAGAILGYYISRTVPLSYGVGLTNPQQIIDWDVEEYVLPAPGVDGVYYGGVDNTLYFFFDAETDTLIMTNNRIKILDKPLDIDAPLFRIVTD